MRRWQQAEPNGRCRRTAWPTPFSAAMRSCGRAARNRVRAHFPCWDPDSGQRDYDTALLISADSDMIPAVRLVVVAGHCDDFGGCRAQETRHVAVTAR